MAASSSNRGRDDVFPSFRGEDVRDSFLSHLLNALYRKSISTFSDNGIERSYEIGPALLSAIRDAKISIVIFSKNYSSSKWCLDELVENHKCYKRSHQKVIPIFYNVDPSEVRKQTGEFKKVFEETCKDKPEVQKQMWKQALTDIANLAGEHLKKGVDEASVVEKIANDVSKKLIMSPSNFSDGLVGIEDHIEAMRSRLCLESEDVRMVGIVGSSGIGKSTIGRELFTKISNEFLYSVFAIYRKTNPDTCTMKLDWVKQFLSDILDQRNIKARSLCEVEQKLKDKKVLIVLDDVDNIELLETLVGNTEWFGCGSRIIVITQDKHLLKAHDIDLIIYEVDFPSKTLALEILCQSAFKQNSPADGFMQVTLKVVELVGNLPLGFSVLGSSLRRRSKDEWMEMLPRLQNILDGDIGKQLRVSYDRLDKEEQLLFLYIACHFNGFSVNNIQKSLGESVKIGLILLDEKSLVRITQNNTVEMHDLLKKLGREIFFAQSSDPGKRLFLVDDDDIRSVLSNNTGTDSVHGIILDRSNHVTETISVHENSFESMPNIQIKNIYNSRSYFYKGEIFMDLPQDLVSLPRQLRVLRWNKYPAKCLPSTYKAEFLVTLIMKRSKLEKLWEGTLPLGNLKVIDMSYSNYLKVIPDLSKAIKLKKLNLSYCMSLVTVNSSIQTLTKLLYLNMKGCKKLENIPTLLKLESLEFFTIDHCDQLRNFPMIYVDDSRQMRSITIEISLWSSNLRGLIFLDCLMRILPPQYGPEYFKYIRVEDSNMKKLWEGVQSFVSLEEIYVSDCDYLKEIPDLSKATNLKSLKIRRCKSLLMVPSTIGSLQKLEKLEMLDCTELKVLPIDVNLSSLIILNFRGCSRLSMFPKISSNIEELYLHETAIEGVPCFIKNFSSLKILKMSGCKKLKNISPKIFRMVNLEEVDFANCENVLTVLSDVSVVKTTKDISAINVGESYDMRWYTDYILFIPSDEYFNFQNCSKLDEDTREYILRSCFKPTILTGGEVPTYFKHRSFGNSLNFTLPQSIHSQNIHFKACVVFEAPFKCPRGLDLDVHFLFNGKTNEGIYSFTMCEINLMFLCSFEFQRKGFNNMKFKFESKDKIKACGVRFFIVCKSPDSCNGSYETRFNQQSGDKCDFLETGGSTEQMMMVLIKMEPMTETGGSKEQVRMESETSRENCNLPCDQNEVDESLKLFQWPKRSG